MKQVDALLRRAQSAKQALAALRPEALNALLPAMADSLVKAAPAILAANARDVRRAQGSMSEVLLDRLRLSEERIASMARGVRAVQALPSPLGLTEREYRHPNGLRIQKVRVPIGVVAIVYESRPNVTGDAAALCVKSGNVALLRGGSDAVLSNAAIAEALRAGLAGAGGPPDAVLFLDDTTHESVQALMTARGFVDLLIPRGGAGLIAAVVNGARGVPVIETGTGICHVYVDAGADVEMAARIVCNAKTSRPSVCNAAEVCLVHRDAAAAFLPLLQETLGGQVELRLDARAAAFISGVAAGPDDFDTEFLGYVLAVGVVDGVRQAVAHINAHGTHHSDAIVTRDEEAAAVFLRDVDSAAVYHNASTRFTDGGEFGLGCEMGISTQKIGARGPMGLYELTSCKYVVHGAGQTR